jgi:hypothetical protein
MTSFQPRPLDGLDAAVVLFRRIHPDGEMLPKGALDSERGTRFAQGLEIIQTKGDHWSYVKDERNTAALARQINRCSIGTR